MLAEVFPVVSRESPVLAGRVFTVNRTSCPKAVIKDVWKSPCIAAVFVHQNRHVALKRNSSLLYGISCRLKLFVGSHLNPRKEKVILFKLAVIPASLDFFFAWSTVFVCPVFPCSLVVFNLKVLVYSVVYNPRIFLNPLFKSFVSLAAFSNFSSFIKAV